MKNTASHLSRASKPHSKLQTEDARLKNLAATFHDSLSRLKSASTADGTTTDRITDLTADSDLKIIELIIGLAPGLAAYITTLLSPNYKRSAQAAHSQATPPPHHSQCITRSLPLAENKEATTFLPLSQKTKGESSSLVPPPTLSPLLNSQLPLAKNRGHHQPAITESALRLSKHAHHHPKDHPPAVTKTLIMEANGNRPQAKMPKLAIEITNHHSLTTPPSEEETVKAQHLNQTATAEPLSQLLAALLTCLKEVSKHSQPPITITIATHPQQRTSTTSTPPSTQNSPVKQNSTIRTTSQTSDSLKKKPQNNAHTTKPLSTPPKQELPSPSKRIPSPSAAGHPGTKKKLRPTHNIIL